jgi:transposase InsO family protein
LKGNQYIIIYVDAVTTHLTAFPTRNARTAAVIKYFIEEIIPKYGLFSIITTVNGSCFRSKLFKEFLTKLNIKHNNRTEYTPTANAMSERYVQTLINCIKSYAQWFQRTGNSI